jgi:hypothetical protein
MFDWTDEERPAFCQLFGGDPATMAEAARVVVEQGCDGVDINMGCWVPKVAKTGAGAALLKDLCQAEAVVKAVVNAVPEVPVTVKVRSGWDQRDVTAIRFARAAAEAGVKAITVHARFASQGFTAPPTGASSARSRGRRRRIPVIGNGDIETPARRPPHDERDRLRRRDGRPRRDGQPVAARPRRDVPGNRRAAARTDAHRAHRRRPRTRPPASGPAGRAHRLPRVRGLLGHYFKGMPRRPPHPRSPDQVTALAEIERVLDNALATAEAGATPRPADSESATAPRSLCCVIIGTLTPN